jgi:hypothetical protein
MDNCLESVSPAKVFFLLLSCIVHISILWKYATRLEAISLEVGFGISPASYNLAPQKLAISSWIHIEILSAIRERCKRYDSPLLGEVYRLLTSCYRRVVLGNDDAESVSFQILMLYRWKGRGTGVVPMEREAALAEWSFPHAPDADIKNCLPGHSACSRALIEEVCSPESRICEEGYFDLSIMI